MGQSHVTHNYSYVLCWIQGWRLNLDIWKVLLDDPRWVDQTGELAPCKFNPDRWALCCKASRSDNASVLHFLFRPKLPWVTKDCTERQFANTSQYSVSIRAQ